jgi:carboxypeptidase C (cathepsin A)
MNRKGFALMAVLAVAGTVSALPTADKVNSLWQMPDLSFGLYSGYLDVTGSSK